MVVQNKSAEYEGVAKYLGELFAYAEKRGIRFPARSPLAAVSLMNNVQRGQWIAHRILELSNTGLTDFPLPPAGVCDLLGLHHLKDSLIKAPFEGGGDEAA